MRISVIGCGSLSAAVTLAAGLLALSSCGIQPGSTRPLPTSSASPSDPVDYADQIVQETNDVRDAHGLTVLDGSQCAQNAALQRASALVGNAELTHAPLAGVIARCKPATTAAENLSRAAASPKAVLDAWMGSPGHRSNLLDQGVTEIGVGCVVDGTGMLCSQVFLGP
jgi:uncharacterized protein YkwD